MTVIPGTHSELKLDKMSDRVFIHLSDEDPVSAEEVIQYLESDALADRTRRRFCTPIYQEISEKGVALILHLRGAWEAFCEWDLVSAFQTLLAKKALQCA